MNERRQSSRQGEQLGHSVAWAKHSGNSDHDELVVVGVGGGCHMLGHTANQAQGQEIPSTNFGPEVTLIATANV